jgi:DNA repair protein RadA/Sms
MRNPTPMKVKTQYSCQSCGHTSAKWLGRCPGCEAWNSFVEERPSAASQPASQPNIQQGSLAAVREQFSHSGIGRSSEGDWTDLDAEPAQGRQLERLNTGMGELNRVLGGGLVPDSFTLLGGDPGIGKSTLLLQVARGVREHHPDLKILYVSGEESVDQIRSRAIRLGVKGDGRISLAAETQLEKVFSIVQELKPHILVMDSLQTFASGYLESAPGSVTQVREVAARLMALAKSARIAVWLVGHVTKEGNIAGPKVVEHMVDTVLYFEGDSGMSYRLLRTVKNRFGSSRELGVFEMDGEGLKEVSNPSSLFLTERSEAVIGTSVGTTLEGTRPILVELQALVAPSPLNLPRRTAVGLDSNRLALLGAILERHMRVRLAEQDLFFNVAGGLKLSEPACDLAAAAAIWSSCEEVAFPQDWVWLGELGLTGEVRRVSQIEVRVEEAKKLGFKTAVIPHGSGDRLKKISGIRLIPISRVREIGELVR